MFCSLPYILFVWFIFHPCVQHEIIEEEIRGSKPDGDTLITPVSAAKNNVVVQEYDGIKFEVNFQTGHKTGFFCDQVFYKIVITHLSSY